MHYVIILTKIFLTKAIGQVMWRVIQVRNLKELMFKSKIREHHQNDKSFNFMFNSLAVRDERFSTSVGAFEKFSLSDSMECSRLLHYSCYPSASSLRLHDFKSSGSRILNFSMFFDMCWLWLLHWRSNFSYSCIIILSLTIIQTFHS